MEESEKRIYNTYLAVSRSAIDKPFKIRKKFDNFEQHKDYPAVVKLGRFFNKHKHININSFFEAPFFVYNEDYFDLNFYCSYKAISTYTRYHENYLLDNPSSKVCMGKIKESIEFIHLYCKGQNISMSSYISHVEPGSAYNSFLTHLKDRKINVYILFAFRNFDIIIRSLDINIKQTFSPCLVRIKYLRTKLYTANQTKKNVDMFKAYLEKTK